MKSIPECEQRSINKLLNFKLPNYMKSVGWVLFIVSFALLLATKFIEGEWEMSKDILKRIILISLFIVVLAREKVEDERMQHLRARAFTLTFVLSALYILIQPVVNFIVGSLLGDDQKLFQDLGDFVILWYMLVVYLTLFYFSKKNA